MNVSISRFKMIWKFLFGGAESVVDYVLDILNTALENLDPSKKEDIQKILNLSNRVLNILKLCGAFLPTKWQTAFAATVDAVQSLSDSLTDLTLTKEEYEDIRAKFMRAVEAWKSDDDETCKE